MDYSEYKTDFYRRWQMRMWRYSLTLIALVFVLDVAVTAYYYFNQEVLYPTVFKTYMLTEIMIPFILQPCLLILEGVLLFHSKLSPVKKNRVNVYSLFTQLSIISFFHNRYEVVMLLPSLVMVLSALLADKKLLKALYWCSLGSVIFSLVIFFVKNAEHEVPQKLIFAVIVFCTQLAMYFVARSIMSFQNAQLNHVYENYTKLGELTVELKLEPLTHLYNRTSYADAVERYAAMSETSGCRLFQVLLDLDNFKKVNDTFGHAAGDVVLITLSQIITKDLGTNRNAFRYGGDEFVILFKDKELNEVIEIVEKIRKDFNEYIFDFADPDFRTSMSIGIAGFRRGMSTTAWFAAADKAAYAAKLKGKNRYVIAE